MIQFDEIKQPTLKEMFVSQMLEKIISGEMKVGDKIPSEREISEKMKISRSMVHIGLEELARLGFVRIEPRRGIYIEDFSSHGNLETFSVLSKYSGSMNSQYSRSVVEFRNAIYGGAMKKLALSHTDEDIKALKIQNSKLDFAINNNMGIQKCTEEMKNFEILVSKLSGNPLFPLVINSFGESYLSLWEKCLKFWGASEVSNQEKIIIQMMEKGEGVQAEKYIENLYLTYLTTK